MTAQLKNTRYKTFPQLPYCCVPAVLQSVLYRHDFQNLDQKTIGKVLGLQLPLRAKELFQDSDILYKKDVPEGGYGTQIEKKEYSVAHFFDLYKIPLSISPLYSFSDVSSCDAFLQEHLALEHDLLFRHYVPREDPSKKGYGHMVLIVSYDKDKKEVLIGDPEFPHEKTLSLSELLLFMSDHWDGIVRGIYVITKKPR